MPVLFFNPLKHILDYTSLYNVKSKVCRKYLFLDKMIFDDSNSSDGYHAIDADLKKSDFWTIYYAVLNVCVKFHFTGQVDSDSCWRRHMAAGKTAINYTDFWTTSDYGYLSQTKQTCKALNSKTWFHVV